MATQKQLAALRKGRRVRQLKAMARHMRASGYRVARTTRVRAYPVRRTVLRRRGGSFMSVLSTINEGLKAISPVSLIKKIAGDKKWEEWRKGKVGKFLIPIGDAAIRAGYGRRRLAYRKKAYHKKRGGARRRRHYKKRGGARKRQYNHKKRGGARRRRVYRRRGGAFLDYLKKANNIAKIIKPVTLIKSLAGPERWDRFSQSKYGKFIAPGADILQRSGYGYYPTKMAPIRIPMHMYTRY